MVKANSDVDIYLEIPDQMNGKVLAEFREDFTKSKLPVKVDLVDSRHVLPEFKAKINEYAIEITHLVQV